MNIHTTIYTSSATIFKEKMLFTRHFAVLIKTGTPILAALDTLQAQAKAGAFKDALQEVIRDVTNGRTLTDALKKHPRLFGTFYVSIIEAGEKSGTLEQNLAFLSKQFERESRLRTRVRSAMIYPTIVIFTLITVVILVSTVALPRLVEFFNAFNQPLPWATRTLIAGVDLLLNYGILMLVGLTVLIVVFTVLNRRVKLFIWWHRLVLITPYIGKLVERVQLTRFARNFGLLMRSGISVVTSLEITANTLSNLVYKQKVLDLAVSVSRGGSISDTLEHMGKRTFPPLVIRMIEVGEKSGTLDDNLQYLADFYEEETDTLFKNLSAVIEPVLLIAIGIVVGFVAIAIITPIYTLTSGITEI